MTQTGLHAGNHVGERHLDVLAAGALGQGQHDGVITGNTAYQKGELAHIDVGSQTRGIARTRLDDGQLAVKAMEIKALF